VEGEHRKRILVIDDQSDERAIQAAMLGHLGYAVDTAEDGETGIRLAADSPPDLILLDVAMPRLDGFTVCRSLREEPATAEVPIIFFTASVVGDLEDRAREAGASGIMVKPLDPREVAARIGELIGPPGADPPS
jgi:DNA-binding response OmpR family regulator